MKKLQRILEQQASASRLLVLIGVVVLALLSVHVFDTPWSLVRLRSITHGVAILDMEFHYTPQHAYQLLTALGPDGRSFYLWRILAALDIVLPALFASVLSVGVTLAFRGTVREDSSLRGLQALPLVALALDYSENLFITALLIGFPTQHGTIAAIAGWITTFKTLAYAASILIAISAAALKTRMIR